MKLTKSQQERINYFKDQMMKIHSIKYRDEYELKSCEVKPLSKSLDLAVVIITSGRIGDEGTMAEFFGRDSIQIFIGKKGKVEYVEKGKVKTYNMRKDNIWTLICANH